MEKRKLRIVLMSLSLSSLPIVGAGQEIGRSAQVILVSGATGTQGGAVARESRLHRAWAHSKS